MFQHAILTSTVFSCIFYIFSFAIQCLLEDDQMIPIGIFLRWVEQSWNNQTSYTMRLRTGGNYSHFELVIGNLAIFEDTFGSVESWNQRSWGSDSCGVIPVIPCAGVNYVVPSVWSPSLRTEVEPRRPRVPRVRWPTSSVWCFLCVKTWLPKPLVDLVSVADFWGIFGVPTSWGIQKSASQLQALKLMLDFCSANAQICDPGVTIKVKKWPKTQSAGDLEISNPWPWSSMSTRNCDRTCPVICHWISQLWCEIPTLLVVKWNLWNFRPETHILLLKPSKFETWNILKLNFLVILVASPPTFVGTLYSAGQNLTPGLRWCAVAPAGLFHLHGAGVRRGMLTKWNLPCMTLSYLRTTLIFQSKPHLWFERLHIPPILEGCY